MKKQSLSPRGKKALTFTTATVLCLLCATPVFAASEVETTMNTVVTFFFGILRIVGIGILGYSLFEFATAIKSHDGAQRAQSILGIAAGLIIVFIREILELIGISF